MNPFFFFVPFFITDTVHVPHNFTKSRVSEVNEELLVWKNSVGSTRKNLKGIKKKLKSLYQINVNDIKISSLSSVYPGSNSFATACGFAMICMT